MKKPVWIIAILFSTLLVGCSGDSQPNPTVPPQEPTHRIAGSQLPDSVGGYTAMGKPPKAEQLTATYVNDNQPLDLVVVTLDPSGEYGLVELGDQQWYGTSRCGILWKGDPKSTPRTQQVACITPLIDGVMTLVSGGTQSVEDIAQLATAMTETLA